jgi:hypothetical protein
VLGKHLVEGDAIGDPDILSSAVDAFQRTEGVEKTPHTLRSWWFVRETLKEVAGEICTRR